MSKVHNFIPENIKQPLSEENYIKVTAKTQKNGLITVLEASGNVYKKIEYKRGVYRKEKTISFKAFLKEFIKILDEYAESIDVPPIEKKEKTNETSEELIEIKEPAVKIGIGE